jgi:RTX calcium-binding nonapeptide repeat (4 copies)
MSQIAVEGYPVSYIGAHLYLVYTDDLNQEWVLRGDPEFQVNGAWGKILTIPGNVLLSASSDNRNGQSPADRWDTVLDLGGRRAEDVWSILCEQAANITRAQLPYTVSLNPLSTTDISQTSNSVVASVLRTAGISVPNGLPSLYLYSGLGNFLTFDYNLTNGDHGGILQGYVGNDTLIGGAGVDKLYGDDGNDTLRGGGGNDPIDGGTGVNTAVYSGRPADHIWFKNAAGSWTIIDIRPGSPDGTDILNDVQFLKFDAGDVIALSPTVAGQPVTLNDQTMAAQGEVTVVSLTHNTGPGTQTLYYNAPITSNGLVLRNINRTDFAFLSWDSAWATVFGYFDDGVHTLGIPQNGNYVGGLTNHSGTDTVQVIKQDKTAFSLKSIALDTFWGENGVVATFTGLKPDGSTVGKTFQLDSSHGLQTFSFDQTFNNLKAVYFTATDSVLFDNITVDPSPPNVAITSVSSGGSTGTSVAAPREHYGRHDSAPPRWYLRDLRHRK